TGSAKGGQRAGHMIGRGDEQNTLPPALRCEGANVERFIVRIGTQRKRDEFAADDAALQHPAFDRLRLAQGLVEKGRLAATQDKYRSFAKARQFESRNDAVARVGQVHATGFIASRFGTAAE